MDLIIKSLRIDSRAILTHIIRNGMKVCLKYGDEIYRKQENYKVRVEPSNGNSYEIPFYNGFKCPKCGLKLPFRSKFGTTQLSFFCEALEKGLSVGTNIEDEYYHKWSHKYCTEPLHKYKLTPIIKVTYKNIGTFRNSPISPRFYFIRKKKFSIRSSNDKWYSAKGYKLKNDSCYVEPIYQNINERKSLSDNINYDIDEDFCKNSLMYEDITPTVKFRKCRPKTNSGARRSTGWKSKKYRKQWGGSCKHYKEQDY